MEIIDRIEQLDWAEIESNLNQYGFSKAGPLLTPAECQVVIELYKQPRRFRSRIEMSRFNFGVGEYQYFANPLPLIVSDLRTNLYPLLAAIANRWMQAMESEQRFPDLHDQYIKLCRNAGQTKPTPLLLYYEEGGYNCLHQDLYGELSFPLQAAFVLSKRDVDYKGGEFLLLEQRPRAQSRGEAITIEQGEMLIFPNNYRPVKGTRGNYRVNMRHGVSRIHSGTRYSLGIIFHDAA
jgi:hypothetical protein